MICDQLLECVAHAGINVADTCACTSVQLFFFFKLRLESLSEVLTLL